jgi:hypothetical protein
MRKVSLAFIRPDQKCESLVSSLLSQWCTDLDISYAK